MIAIECKEVSKSFGKTKVLDQVNIQLEQGKIYALLGRNGAGKTTLMNCLCTRYLPDAGEIYLLEEKAYENEKVLNEICFMSDYMETFSTKKVKDILKFAGSFYEKWDKDLMKNLMEFFEISPKVLYDGLSKGQKTVVGIIIGLCSGCEIVLLDEIYSGLDAVARQNFYEILMKEQEKNPRTFVLSTHLIEEMAGLFEHVVMIDKGKIILSEEVEIIHEKSYKCVGRAELEGCLSGKNILSKQQMGAMAEYYIYDELNERELGELMSKGFTVSALSLQELFLAFTADTTKKWGENSGIA